MHTFINLPGVPMPPVTSPSANTSVHTTTGFGPFNWIALILVVVGAVNWGLVGAFGFDLVAFLFGNMTTLSRAVYILVGLAGLYCLSIPMRTRAIT